MTLSLVATVLFAGLCLAVCILLFPKISLAWDPNSHDKLTNFALDLLATRERPSLLGWVLAACRPKGESLGPAPPLLHPLSMAIEMQTRRGSVEEDMNSHLLRHEFFELTNIDSFEGANGGYHFYCPLRDGDRGLTDPTFLLTLVGQAGSGCEPPMPSALIRATDGQNIYDPGYFGEIFNRNWHLDKEGRNYTYDEALRYYRNGYSHLAFYAIGRVCHLLQDMAVPAHVRDDAHVGGKFQNRGFDPSDPMERFGEERDWPVPFNTRPGDGTYYHELWSFLPYRIYSHDTVYTNAASDYANNDLDIQDAFHSLALNTFKAWFSYNTIPYNVDSHHPITPEVMPFVHPITLEEMGKRCAIETDALWGMLRRVADLAGALYRHRLGTGRQDRVQAMIRTLDALKMHTVGTTKDTSRPINPVAIVGSRLIDTVAIVGIGCRFVPLANDRLLALLDDVVTWCDDAENELPNLDALIKSGRPAGASTYQAVSDLVQYKKTGIPEALRAILRADPSIKLDAALGKLVFQSDISLDVLRAWFYLKTAQGQYQGPFCLTEEIIVRQYLRQQEQAVRYTASLLAKWYESVFAPKFPPLAVARSVNAARFEDIPELAPLQACERNQTAFAATKWATIALFDHLPIPVDITMKISLEQDGTDKDLFEQGVALELRWDLVLGRDLDVTHDDPSYLIDAVRSFVASPACRDNSAAIPFTLVGKTNSTYEIKRTLVPYNLEALLRLWLPTGKWSQIETSMGGIHREDETANLPPLRHDQRDDPTNSKVTVSMLRIRPVGPQAKTDATPTK